MNHVVVDVVVKPVILGSTPIVLDCGELAYLYGRFCSPNPHCSIIITHILCMYKHVGPLIFNGCRLFECKL